MLRLPQLPSPPPLFSLHSRLNNFYIEKPGGGGEVLIIEEKDHTMGSMTGHDFIIFYERFGIFKLANHLKVLSNQIEHTSLEDPISYFDLRHKGVTYDVKISSPVSMGGGKKQLIWDFELRQTRSVNGKNKKRGRSMFCDFYLLIGMQRSLPEKVFLVPSNETPKHHVRISIKGESKYHKYEI